MEIFYFNIRYKERRLIIMFKYDIIVVDKEFEKNNEIILLIKQYNFYGLFTIKSKLISNL